MKSEHRLLDSARNGFLKSTLPLLVILLIFAFAVIEPIVHYRLNYRWDDWTGFSGSPPAQVDTENNLKDDPDSKELQTAKTFWDWLDLLIAPLALALVAVWFNKLENDRKQERETFMAEQSNTLALRLARSASHDTALHSYFDKISEFVLSEKLDVRARNRRYRAIAQLRTFSLISILREIEDVERKSQVIHFLYGLGLLSGSAPIISVAGMDLSHINLQAAEMPNINLSGSSLFSAVLIRAHIEYAILERTNLQEAKLTNAVITGAVVKNAAFIETDVTGAILLGTDFTEQQLRSCVGWGSAVLPKRLEALKNR